MILLTAKFTKKSLIRLRDIVSEFSVNCVHNFIFTLFLPNSNSITTKQTETANSVFSPSPLSSPIIIPESQVENGPKCTKPVSAVMQKQKQLQQHSTSTNSSNPVKTATTEAPTREEQGSSHPVVQENPFSRAKKTNIKAADAKARALFKSCQDAANRTVIESMGNVDQRNNTECSTFF